MINIKCYISSGGKNEIKNWYEELPTREQGKFSGLIDELQLQPEMHWKHEHSLKNTEGLYVIRIKIQKNQHRLIGFFHEKEFIMLCHFIEKKTQQDYKIAIDKAHSRKEEVLSDESRAINYVFKANGTTGSPARQS